MMGIWNGRTGVRLNEGHEKSNFLNGSKPHLSWDTWFSARLRARCGSRFQKAETTPAKAARGAFFAHTAKNAFFEERAKIKVKVKTLGEESPRPSLFFHQ
ncbi:MAG: hypothetical protein H7834_13830 [Magnetococcus sp. YQC-9]